MSTKRASALPSVRLMRGFGLIELMVAMVLGLLVIGAAFAVFQSNQTSYRANEGLNRMQESARVAFEMMSRDIRAAGGSACSNKSILQTTGSQATAYNNAIQATVNDGNNSLASARDEVSAISGDDTAYKVTASTSSSVTLDLTGTGLANASEAFQVGDLMLLCNARYTYMVTASGVSGNTVSFAALPGGYDPYNDPKAPPQAVVLARFRQDRWYVGANGRGTNSLFVNRNGTAQEIAEGVDSLRVRYLESSTESGCVVGTAYTDAPTTPGCVTAVRVDMRLRGQDLEGNAFTRDFANVVSLRSRNL